VSCKERENLLKNIPIILQGSEKYNIEDTKKYVSLIMAYNLLPEVKKQLRYETLLKPVDKDGNNKGKFVELTSSELKECVSESERIVSAIEYFDSDIEYENRQKQKESLKNRQQEEIIAQAEYAEKQNDAVAFLSDKPLEKIKLQYYRIHKGDDDALSTVLWAFCYKWVKDAKDEGIHIIAVGQRGSGKSHGITSAMTFLPPELALVQGISARYLYYAKNLLPGMTIYVDELPSDQTLLDSLKAIITSYPTGGKRGVVVNHEAMDLIIPPRVTINTSSVDQTNDEQFTNRLTVIRGNEDSEKKKDRVNFRIKLYEDDVEHVDPKELDRIHNALRHISNNTFIVFLPSGAIECENYSKIDMRVFNQFCGAMFGNAILNYPKRIHEVNSDGNIEVTVSEEDFKSVIHMYQDPNQYYLKLTTSAIIIKKYLEGAYPAHKSIGDISIATNLSTQTVRNTLMGRKDRNIESLINAGYAEEVNLSEQADQYAPRLSTKVYKATQPAKQDDEKPQATEKASGTQSQLGDLVGMLKWNSEKANEQTKQTTTNQPLVCTNSPQ